MAALVERQRRVLDDLVGRGRARGEEARADPAEHRVRGRVVGGHDDHAPAAAGADPVLGQRDGLRRARARGVDLRVRPARADQLGELRVAHRQHAEQEAAVERVRLVLDLAAHVVDAPLDLGEHDGVGAVVVEHARVQRLERVEPLTAHVVDRVAGTSSAISSSPGNADAKMTPVSSRSSSGSDQRSGSFVPLVVVL